MNYRATVEIVKVINNHGFILILPMGAPFEDCRAALSELSQGIDFLEQQAKDQNEAVKAQAAQSPLAPEVVHAELTD